MVNLRRFSGDSGNSPQSCSCGSTILAKYHLGSPEFWRSLALPGGPMSTRNSRTKLGPGISKEFVGRVRVDPALQENGLRHHGLLHFGRRVWRTVDLTKAIERKKKCLQGKVRQGVFHPRAIIFLPRYRSRISLGAHR